MCDEMKIRKEYRLQQYILKTFTDLRDKEQKKEEKRKEKLAAKHEEAIRDYRSREEIIEAWGCDCISKREMEKLLDAWDNAHSEASADQIMIMDWLDDEISTSRMVIRDLERQAETFGFELGKGKGAER